MKWNSPRLTSPCFPSLPVRGAWVEISLRYKPGRLSASLPVRGAWVEMLDIGEVGGENVSLPVRGAWVEIARIKA